MTAIPLEEEILYPESAEPSRPLLWDNIGPRGQRVACLAARGAGLSRTIEISGGTTLARLAADSVPAVAHRALAALEG
jgi:hypothetical protein